MQNRNIPLVVLSSLFVLSGCHGPGDTSEGSGTSRETPTAPAAPYTYSTLPDGTPNWQADATVVSVVLGSHPPCGWGTATGEVRFGVGWRITTAGDSIALDEDMHNWATDDNLFLGHLDGTQFAASMSDESDYANSVCEFRGGTLTGHFTSDSTFEAVETLVWGTPGTETTVTRHWKGSRL